MDGGISKEISRFSQVGNGKNRRESWRAGENEGGRAMMIMIVEYAGVGGRETRKQTGSA
jgi:hypothetical protein